MEVIVRRRGSTQIENLNKGGWQSSMAIGSSLERLERLLSKMNKEEPKTSYQGFLGIPGTESLEADRDSVTFPNEVTPLVKGQVRNFSFQFIYRKGIRRITLERFLVTRLIRFPGTVTLLEVLVLYDNLLWCNAKAASDPKFNEKFGKTLEVLTQILKETRIGNRLRNLRILSDKLKKALPEEFLFPERNLDGVQKVLRDAVYVSGGELGRPNSTFPPRTFIGKGYRDHGCLRNTAWDGSPSWQEVAMAHLDILEQSNAST